LTQWIAAGEERRGIFQVSWVSSIGVITVTDVSMCGMIDG